MRALGSNGSHVPFRGSKLTQVISCNSHYICRSQWRSFVVNWCIETICLRSAFAPSDQTAPTCPSAAPN